MTASNLIVDYTGKGSDDQAKEILDHFLGLHELMPGKELGFTYSARWGQRNNILAAHKKGQSGAKGIGGSNQAPVIGAMHTLMQKPPYNKLENVLKIMPVTTMQYYPPDIKAYPVPDKICKADLKYAEQFAKNNHLVVWGNQDTKVAIGGCGLSANVQNVAATAQSKTQKDMIMHSMKKLLQQQPKLSVNKSAKKNAPLTATVKNKPQKQNKFTGKPYIVPSKSNDVLHAQPKHNEPVKHKRKITKPSNKMHKVASESKNKVKITSYDTNFLSEANVASIKQAFSDTSKYAINENKAGDKLESIGIANTGGDELVKIAENAITSSAGSQNVGDKIEAIVTAAKATMKNATNPDGAAKFDLTCGDKAFLEKAAKAMVDAGIPVKLSPSDEKTIKANLGDDFAKKYDAGVEQYQQQLKGNQP